MKFQQLLWKSIQRCNLNTQPLENEYSSHNSRTTMKLNENTTTLIGGNESCDLQHPIVLLFLCWVIMLKFVDDITSRIPSFERSFKSIKHLLLQQCNKNKQVSNCTEPQESLLNCQSGRFQHQNPVVRIQSSANYYVEHLFTENWTEKTKIRKRCREWPIFKT